MQLSTAAQYRGAADPCPGRLDWKSDQHRSDLPCKLSLRQINEWREAAEQDSARRSWSCSSFLLLEALMHWGFLLQQWFSSRIPALNNRAGLCWRKQKSGALMPFGLVLVPAWFSFSAPAASVWSHCAGHGHLHSKSFVFSMNSADFTAPAFNSNQNPIQLWKKNHLTPCSSSLCYLWKQQEFFPGANEGLLLVWCWNWEFFPAHPIPPWPAQGSGAHFPELWEWHHRSIKRAEINYAEKTLC